MNTTSDQEEIARVAAGLPLGCHMNRLPLLSLVIPTKNRYPYLMSLVRYLSGIKSDELEIVIQDNSPDNDEIIGLLSYLNDSRIRYHHQPEWLCVSDNCEMAIRHATGEYICMLGDDDGVTPQILQAVRWMKDCGVDALLTSKPTYHWPGMISRLGGMTDAGRVFLYDYNGSARKIDVQGELQKVLRGGATQLLSLPRVYHGIVARKCMDELRQIAKTSFPGPSPDMANAVGLTCTVRTMYYVDIPLIINGNCPSSTGGLGARAAHHGEIHEMNFLPPNLVREWPVQIPYFWSGPTILAASAVLSLRNTGRAETIADLNLPALYSTCLMFHGDYANRIVQAARKNKVLGLLHLPDYMLRILQLLLLRGQALGRNLLIKLRPAKSEGEAKLDVSSIDKAIEYLTATERYRAMLGEAKGFWHGLTNRRES